MTLSCTIATRVNELMQNANITQYRLFKISGVSQSSISDLRSQKNQKPNLSHIQQICDGLKIGLRKFFDSPLFSRENITD